MSSEMTSENKKGIKKMHTKMLIIFLAIIVVLSILSGIIIGIFSFAKQGATGVEYTVEKTVEAINKTAKLITQEKQNITSVVNNPPTYTIELLEEPVITMWEFTSAVDERNAAVIGAVIASPTDERTDYDIVFMKEESLISDDYNYYLCIKGRWEKEYLCFKVNEVTIDDVWNTLRLHIEDWNQLTTKEVFLAKDYNRFHALSSHLKRVAEDYTIRGIPASYFIVKGELLT